MSTNRNLNNKLFLMYLIAKFPGRTESDLIGLALRSLYLDYFSFSESYEQLSEQALIYSGSKKDDPRLDAKGRSEKRVYLSEQGQAVLAELEQDLAPAIRATVERLSLAAKPELEQRESVLARYTPAGEGYYELELSLLDGSASCLALRLRLPSEKLCQKIARRWKADSLSLYTLILNWTAAEAEDPTAKDSDAVV